MENTVPPTGGPSINVHPSGESYLRRMVPRSRVNPATASSWMNNQPPLGDRSLSPLDPQYAWMLDEIRKAYPNIPEDVLMDILKKKYQNMGPQIRNPSLPAPMPTTPNRNGGSPQGDPLGLGLQIKGLGL